VSTETNYRFMRSYTRSEATLKRQDFFFFLKGGGGGGWGGGGRKTFMGAYAGEKFEYGEFLPQ